MAEEAFLDDACLDGRLKLLPEAEIVESLRRDYETMVDAGMMYSEPPAFDEILEFIRVFWRSCQREVVGTGFHLAPLEAVYT